MRILLPVAMMAFLAASPAARAEIQFLSFSANGLAVSQAAGGNSYSGQLSWNPTVGTGTLAVRGNLGITLLKSSFDSNFTALNYQVFLKYGILPIISLEGGGGLETWVDNGGTHLILSGNLNFETPWKLLGLFDRIFAGYSRFFLTNNATNEFKVGVGFEI